MIAANDYVDPMLPRMSAMQLRQLIAQAAGLLAHEDPDGTRATLENIASRLPSAGPRVDPGAGEQHPGAVVYLSLFRGLVRKPLTMARITQEVAEWYGIPIALVRGPSRQRSHVIARHEAMYQIYMTGRFSMPQIGRYFDRDHTTVLHAIRSVEKRMASKGEAA